MTDEVDELHEKLFNGLIELDLNDSAELRSLLESAPYDNVKALEILAYLFYNQEDLVAKRLAASKLMEIYESGNMELIYKYQGDHYFIRFLSIEELLFLIFDSKSPITQKFLEAMERNHLSADSLKEFFLKLSQDHYNATISLLTGFFLTLGSEVLDDFRFREAVSHWKIYELFNIKKSVF